MRSSEPIEGITKLFSTWEIGRRSQSGEGWHSNENAICLWNSSPRIPQETYSRCYASATAYGMMIPPCNSCSRRSKRPRH